MRIAVVLVCALLLAACGGGGGHKPAGEAAKPASQVVADAQQAARSARTVRVSGSIVQGKDRLSLDLRIARNARAVGLLRLRGMTVRIIRVGGTVYLKTGAAFWKGLGARSAAERLQNKWVRVPASSSNLALVDQLTDLNTLFSNTLRSHGRLENKGTRSYKGGRVVVVEDTGTGGELYVAASGPPYPLAIVGTKHQGTVDFGDWNQIVPVVAPKGALDLNG